MQKVVTSTPTTKLEENLGRMNYNEKETENISSILNWISKRNDKIESIVGGQTASATCSKGTTGLRDEFRIGDKTVTVCYLDEAMLKQSLESAEATDTKPASSTEKERQERASKFKKLVADLSSDLCAAEGLATLIPQSQVKEFDLPTWQHQIVANGEDAVCVSLQDELASSSASGKRRIVFIQLSREGYSMEKILRVFSAIVESDEKFILVMNSRTTQDSGCLLPVAYLIDALNTANIRKWPIDLLLLDRSLEDAIIRFLGTSKKVDASQVYLWGDSQFNNSFPTQLSSGVVGPGAFGARAHFIFDSLADVQTTVDSIVAEVWSSGVRVNHRTRSVVFVHQPMYSRVIKFLEKKVSFLKTSDDQRLKSNDFVKRTGFGQGGPVDIKKIQNEGVKMFPSGSDFSTPTLLYDVGTSCDIMASSTPHLGHVLFVVSYRSAAELFSLANNYGENNEVFIHSQDWATIKEIAANIKASTIWVNSNRRHDLLPPRSLLSNQDVLCKLSPNMQTPQDESQPTKAEIDEFAKSVLLAEKALKLWSSFGTEKKHSMVVEAFLSIVQHWTKEQSGSQKTSVQDTDRFRFLSELMRVAGRMFNEDENKLLLTQYKPHGIIAFAFPNPENMSLEATLLPILLALLKGNTVVVVSRSNPYSDSILKCVGPILPAGSVQFVQSPNISHSAQLISHPGKVSLLWVIHSGQVRPEKNKIPFTSFDKVVVSTADVVQKSPVAYARQLELVKTIIL